uniref:Small blue copper protein Bcp1 n=2 Tax=Paraboea crassifolia TaxID=104990 RepID=Q84RM1_9LAMI|nr:small blue copper protein Bcp1 [Paraboea crassifolia]
MGGLKVFASVLFLVAVAVSGLEQLVSAETHHHVGGEEGWNSASNISSWLSGRVFRVGDKLWFSVPATADSIVELQSLEELATCDLRNPIRMYADGSNHVTLDKEGTRYFSSGNLESCKNGMKLPVTVQNRHDEDKPYRPDPPVEPYPHHHDEGEPYRPDPPVEPYPHPPPTTPHPYPAAATALNVFLSVVFDGLFLSCIGM